MKIASQRLPSSSHSDLCALNADRPFGIKNLQIPLCRLCTHIDFYFMYFQALTNPFSTNPFLSTSIQNPRVCTLPALCALPTEAGSPLSASNGFVISSLPPLVLSWLSFSSSCLLFSIVYSLFSQNTGGGGTPFKTGTAISGCPPPISYRADITIMRRSDDF